MEKKYEYKHGTHMIEQNTALDNYVGAKIRERRLKLNWTLSELAAKLSVSHQQIQKYEQGSTRVSAGVMYKLSQIFSIEPSYFFDGFEDPEGEIDDLVDVKETVPTHRNRPLDIMIVEHDANDELVLRNAIKNSGVDANILTFHDGDKALNFLKNKSNLIKFPRPELIILELNVPKADGYFLLKEIKRDRELCDIPVLVLTNSISRSQMIDCYKNHAVGFMRKIQNTLSFEEGIKAVLQYWGHSMSLPAMYDYGQGRSKKKPDDNEKPLENGK